MTVPISVSDARGIAGGDLTLNYDATVLTAVQVQAEGLLSSTGIAVVSNLNTVGKVIVSMAGATGIASGSGALMGVSFEIKADAKEGVSPLSLQASLKDQDGKVLPSAVVAGSVTVSVGLLGDVNNDRLVDSGDAILVLRYAVRLITFTDAQKDLGDVNGDRSTDSGDAVLILRRAVKLIERFPREGAPKLAEGHGDLVPGAAFGEMKVFPQKGVEAQVMLDAGTYGADLTITYDASAYRTARVRPAEGVLLVSNADNPGEVHLSVARTEAAEPLALWIELEGAGQELSLRLTGNVFGGDGGPAGAVERLLDRPLTSSLSAAYPNPFNPSTTVRYALAQDGETRLTVYNLSGQVVRRLVSGRQQIGRYAVVWDGRDEAGRGVASGIYIARLDAGAVRQAQKMLLLK
ncbi:MAG: T9SS type A sorting domain-containing protein [Candidatus Latescibacteria bacterium]|nr:T9SS type A sorting domain-containing protein [Candidatus Latescibacterota bacterium]